MSVISAKARLTLPLLLAILYSTFAALRAQELSLIEGPVLRLAWEHSNPLPDVIPDPHAFIVHIRKLGEPYDETNPYPTKVTVYTPATIANPPLGHILPLVPLVAEVGTPAFDSFRVTLGEVATGTYNTIVTAVVFLPDGTLSESTPSNEISYEAFTISVTESTDGTDWTEMFSKSFVRDAPRKFFSIKFK